MPHFEPINDDIHFQLKLSKLSSWSDCKNFKSKNKFVTSNGKTYILLEKKELFSKTLGKFLLGLLAVIFSVGLSLLRKDVRNLFTGREVKRLALLQAPQHTNKTISSEKKLLPELSAPLPLDVVEYILKNYPSEPKISRMIELNSSWLPLIKNNGIIDNNLCVAYCLAHAKNIVKNMEGDSKEQSDAYLNIVKVEVRHNLSEAKKTLQLINKIYNASNFISASLEIAKIDHQYCLKKAKKSLNSIYNLTDRRFAQFYIVEIESQTNLENAKQTALSNPNLFREDFFMWPFWQTKFLLEIAKNDPAHDFSEVKKLWDNFQDLEMKDQFLYEIVKVEVFFDLANAKWTTQRIQNTYYRSQALLEIIKVEVLHDFKQALETAQTIEDSMSKVKAYVEIAKVDPKHDVTKALKYMSNIPNFESVEQKIFLLIEIAEVDPQHDFTLAKEAAAQNLDDYLQSLLLLEIVKVEVKYDMSNAIQTALGIKDLSTQIEAFIEIAKVDPKHDFTLPKRCVENFIDPINKSRELFSILEAEALHCLSQAKQTLKMIEDKDYQQLALREIVKAEARSNNFFAAKETANTIENPILQLDAYLEIAKFALESK